MKKIRIGVLGGYRGTSMINYCKRADNAEIVAICDKLCYNYFIIVYGGMKWSFYTYLKRSACRV